MKILTRKLVTFITLIWSLSLFFSLSQNAPAQTLETGRAHVQQVSAISRVYKEGNKSNTSPYKQRIEPYKRSIYFEPYKRNA